MPSRIFSMSFNITSTLLCVSSATETIHIFKLGQQGPPSGDQSDYPGGVHSSLGSPRDRALSQSSLGDDASVEADGADITARKHNGTLMGMLRRTSQSVGSSFASTVGGYLPKGVTEIWEPARDFAWIKLPKAGNGSNGAANVGPLRSVVAMSSNTPQVMVVTSDGSFYVFNIDLSKGGEGTLTKQYSYVQKKLSNPSPTGRAHILFRIKPLIIYR